MNRLRVIPSIDQLRQRDGVRELEHRYGRDLVTEALRDAAGALREELARGASSVDRPDEAARSLERRAGALLRAATTPSLRRVINATGVIVHTNLGRAPLASAAIDAVARVSRGYTNLEYDLDQGARGDRTRHASVLLQRLTGAEEALVVNNNAAAVLLTLTALAAGREVVISRGELVEIGGGFRIPDVLRASGATLREVGTTNRTRVTDYAAAIGDRTALILRVHPSNFRIEGFASRPSVADLVALGRRFEIPVVEDLGGGSVYDTGTRLPGIDEPTVQSRLRSGVAVCCVSGDKLLGGPQAGIILGRAADLAPIARHPLMRAVRADKLAYAALEATLLEHLGGRAVDTVPVARMVASTPDALRERAIAIQERVAAGPGLHVTVTEGRAAVGGGTTPGVTLPSVVLEVAADGVPPDELGRRLRRARPPVIGRIERDRLRLDLRTVAPEEDQELVEALQTVGRPEREEA